MKQLLALIVVSAIAYVSSGCSTAPGKAAVVKSPVANAQFRGSDHMPPEALAAKRAAGN